MIKFSLIKNICKSVSLIINNNNEHFYIHSTLKLTYGKKSHTIYYIPVNDFAPIEGEIKIEIIDPI